MAQQTASGQSSQPWSRLDIFSVQRHQALQADADRSRYFFSEDDEVIEGPHGRTTKKVQRPARKIVAVRITGTTINLYGGGTAALGPRYYAGRWQVETGVPVDPTSAAPLSALLKDFNTIDDVYLENPFDTGHDLTADGTLIVFGTMERRTDGTHAPSLPLVRMLGGGSGSLPTGQYQGMAWEMVADNAAAWDFPIGHAIF